MKQSFTQFLGIIALAVFLSSCSSLENLSVKWKHRNDYWVKKSETSTSRAKHKSSEVDSAKEIKPIEKEMAQKAKTSAVIAASNESASSVASTKNLTIGSATKDQKVSKPASPLEKKVSKLQKRFKKVNENGSTWGGLAFVFGLLGLVGLFFYGPIVILSLFAIIFGIISISGDKNGQGLGIVGLILGILTILILIGAIAFFSAAFF